MGYANVPLDSVVPSHVLSHLMKQSRMQAMIAVLRARKHMRVPLPEIQRVAGAQHGARIRDARDLGYVIDNEMERTPDGEIHSWYVLRAEPGESISLFGDLRPQPRYPD